MLFLAGLELLSKEEKTALLAQLNVLTPASILNEAGQRSAHTAKKWVMDALTTTTQKVSAKKSEWLRHVDQSTDWDPAVLRRSITDESQRLSALTETVINAGIRRHLVHLAGTAADIDETELATGVVARAARSLKIDPAVYGDAVSLESRVFEESLKQLVAQVQKMLEHMPAGKLQELEALLRAEIEKLSAADHEAIRKALNIDHLSAEALLSVLKTGSGVLLGQLLVGSFGFGAFLFLATTLKAIGLLFGATFAFGTFTAASSALSFLLSGPFFLLAVLASGGAVLWSTSTRLNGLMAQTLIVIGRGRLLADPRTAMSGGAPKHELVPTVGGSSVSRSN